MADLPNFGRNQPSEEELSNFLSKVDEIDAVIKGLNTYDEEKIDQYSSKADDLIKKYGKDKKEKEDFDPEDKDLPKTNFGFSKTQINKSAYKNEDTQPKPPQPAVLPTTSNQGAQPQCEQQAFMAAMESDAKERARDRAKRQVVSDGFKDQGNEEFKKGNYKEALEFYDKAFELIRDNLALYTNRAQAKIKLEMYKEALNDCHWALRLTPNSMKAMVQQGHAYLGLKEYEAARESYRDVLNINPKKELLVKEYVAEVDRVEQASQAEAKAAELFEAGQDLAKGVVDILGKVARLDQLPLYYSGGFRVLASLLTNVDNQTIFRTHNGLQLPIDHPVFKRCLSMLPNALTREDRDCLSAGLDMLTAACKDNETSQQKLLQLPGFPDQILTCLEAKFKGTGRLLRTSYLNLMHEFTLTDAGRGGIVGKFDVHRLMSSLLPLMIKQKCYTDTAAAVLNNIALERRVKTLLRDSIEVKVLPEFENLLSSNKTSANVAGLAASSATNLAGDTTIRNKMAARSALWDTCALLMVSFLEAKHTEPLASVTGLLVNMSTLVDPVCLTSVNVKVTEACYKVMTSSSASDPAVTRALGVISNVILQNSDCVDYMSEPERLLAVSNFAKCEDSVKVKSALKCLTALIKDKQSVRQLVADNKGTSLMLTFLNSEEENILGNAALCLSNLCSVPKVCSKLTKTNIIQRLLVLARDANKPTVQSNCAILIGKLAQGDQRHLERLRELHGIEILHDCMKHVAATGS